MNIQERVLTVELKLANLETKITKMDEERTWLVRLVMGLVISAVTGLVLVSK